MANTTSWRCTEIRVYPGRELATDSIRALSGCSEGLQLAQYSTELIEDRLERHPWIQEAEVQRRPPDVLEIKIRERVCVAILRDSPEFGVSEDLHVVPCENRPWVNLLPWISVDGDFFRQVGPLVAKDPLLPLAKELVRVRAVAPDLADNIAEMYRVQGEWGAVLANPVLSLALTPNITDDNWRALDVLLADADFQEKLDSASVVDMRLPGFVTLQAPVARAEETKHS